MKHGVEGVEIGSDAEIQWTGHLLQLNPDGIRRALMFKATVSSNIYHNLNEGTAD